MLLGLENRAAVPVPFENPLVPELPARMLDNDSDVAFLTDVVSIYLDCYKISACVKHQCHRPA